MMKVKPAGFGLLAVAGGLALLISSLPDRELPMKIYPLKTSVHCSYNVPTIKGGSKRKTTAPSTPKPNHFNNFQRDQVKRCNRHVYLAASKTDPALIKSELRAGIQNLKNIIDCL